MYSSCAIVTRRVAFAGKCELHVSLGQEDYSLARAARASGLAIENRLDVIEFPAKANTERAFRRQPIHEAACLSDRLFPYLLTVKQPFPFTLKIVFAYHPYLQSTPQVGHSRLIVSHWGGVCGHGCGRASAEAGQEGSVDGIPVGPTTQSGSASRTYIQTRPATACTSLAQEQRLRTAFGMVLDKLDTIEAVYTDTGQT